MVLVMGVIEFTNPMISSFRNRSITWLIGCVYVGLNLFSFKFHLLRLINGLLGQLAPF